MLLILNWVVTYCLFLKLIEDAHINLQELQKVHMGRKNEAYSLHKMRKMERNFITEHTQDKQSSLIRKAYINKVPNDYIWKKGLT